ncbi:MAG: response regulator transcription factor [Rhodospirillaceae bacterium]|nr:response regulator transcription factor [Rhodospirillaceae bacterium]
MMPSVADMAHILVVDDDDRLRDLLVKYLSENDYLVSGARNAADARAKLKGLTFDLIVLDLMMPGESGLEFANDFRQTNSTPILMLTAMNESGDRIRGLEHGADDYLGKPFEPRELVLRIENILKRLPDRNPLPLEIRLGDVLFRPVRGELEISGRAIRLTDIEAALLGALAERSGEILNRDELINLTGTSGGGRAIDVQVTRLRRKIERDPKLPRYLQTVRGKGYVLMPD